MADRRWAVVAMVALLAAGAGLGGCGGNSTAPSEEPEPPRADGDSAVFAGTLGPIALAVRAPAAAPVAGWDPRVDPLSPVVNGLQLEMQNLSYDPDAHTLVGQVRVCPTTDHGVLYRLACRVTTPAGGARYDGDPGWPALIGAKKSAWIVWSLDDVPGQDFAFAITISWVKEFLLVSTSAAGRPTQVYLTDIDGWKWFAISGGSGAAPDCAGVPSPDGTKVAWLSARDHPEDWTHLAIYVANIDGSAAQRITAVEGQSIAQMAPEWSPDGTKIAYCGWAVGGSRGASNLDVFVINADGSALRNLTTSATTAYADAYPTWTADGSAIIYEVTDDGTTLWEMDATDGANKAQLYDATDSDVRSYTRHPSVSPDGNTIAFDDGRNIWLLNSDGTNPRQITTGTTIWKSFPRWSPDGRFLTLAVYHSTSPSGWYLQLVNTQGALIRETWGFQTDVLNLPNPWGPLEPTE